MTKSLCPLGAAALLVVLNAASAAGQVSRPLAPAPSRGLPVTPFMEGWYENDDGTFTISFGYLNRNQEDVVRIPIGEKNSIEPEEFSGMQPTVFAPGRHRGVFVVTLPPDQADVDVWWTIVNENGEVHNVPGRTSSHAYQLDRIPRPAGSLPPLVRFTEDGPSGRDPTGIMADDVLPATVGEPITLSLWAEDPSQRDPEDSRFESSKPLRVIWSLQQSPPSGDVEFARHESTPPPEEPEEEEEDPPGPRRPPPPPPGPEEVMLPEGFGVAMVYATFSEPGEYVLRGQVDNWRAPDSSSGDQCCWSNGFVRVNVEP